VAAWAGPGCWFGLFKTQVLRPSHHHAPKPSKVPQVPGVVPAARKRDAGYEGGFVLLVGELPII